MASGWETLATGGVAFVGVGVGVWLNGVSESRRWRRDYLFSRITGYQTHFGDVIEAIDAQLRVCAQLVSAVKGEGVPHPQALQERFDSSTDQWARLVSRNNVEAPHNVQTAVMTFDKARAKAIIAVKSKNADDAEAGFTALSEARTAVLTEINRVLHSMQDSQAAYLLPLWERIYRWAFRKPFGPPREDAA